MHYLKTVGIFWVPPAFLTDLDCLHYYNYTFWYFKIALMDKTC